MTTPDPATLSWLLRKASLELWHTRQRAATVHPDSPVGRYAKFNLIRKGDFRQQLADIIRKHGQEGTE